MQTEIKAYCLGKEMPDGRITEYAHMAYVEI